MRKLFAVLAVAVVAVVGCGDDDESDPRRDAFITEMDHAGVDYDEDLVVEAAQQYCHFIAETGDERLATDYVTASYGPELAGLRHSFYEAAQGIYCPPPPYTPPPFTPEPVPVEEPVTPAPPAEPEPTYDDEYNLDPNLNVGPDGVCVATPCGANGIRPSEGG